MEVIILPVMENSEPEQTPHLSNNGALPMFKRAQIEEWAKAPEIQALFGALKNAGLPDDIDMKKIRTMRKAEKYSV